MTEPLLKYTTPAASLFSTPFRTLYDTIWEAETRFDLLFRRDKGPVYLWASNRVRFYYDLTSKLGIYTPQRQPTIMPVIDDTPVELNSLLPADAYIQTGALGPSAENRARYYGCVYTERYVKKLLDKERSVLLVHDRPEKLIRHPKLQVITSKQLAGLSTQTKHKMPPPEASRIGAASIEFWKEVDAFIHERLGVSLLDQARIEQLISYHLRTLATHEQLFARVRPKCFILMTHYFRAPQIEAAQRSGARVIDYQHGINSRYHLGYGFPHLQPDHRKIPYFPNEFWSWGDFWTDPEWFPHACCEPRALGHYQAQHSAEKHSRNRHARTLILATSWAMQEQFRKAAHNLARHLPDWRIIVKLHPRESEDAYAAIAQEYPNVTIVPGSVDILEASKSADIVASICSSALFDVQLNGCKVMVINSPSVEYAEDFVRRFNVPIMQPDAANVVECITRCQAQTIPLRDLFNEQREDYLDITIDSITSPGTPELPGRMPVAIGNETSWRDRLKKHTEVLFRSASPSMIVTGDAGTSAWPTRQLDAFVARSPELPHNAALQDLTEATEAEDLDRISVLIPALIRDGASSRKYRTQFLHAIWTLEQSSKRKARHRMRDYIEALPSEELAYNLPLFEHAVRLGVGCQFLDRYSVRPGARIWKTASGLLSQTSHIARRMCASVEELAEACHAEWLDSRVAQKDQLGLFRHLKQRLDAETPFAMMRLGDGEAYGFSPGYVKASTLARDREQVENVWWGNTQSETQRARLRREFLSSLNAADYLGVPSPFRLLRDIPSLLPDLRRPIDNWHKTARAHFILLTELSHLQWSGDLELAGKHLVDDRCHQPLFTPKLTRNLLAKRHHVVCVSCFTKAQLNAALQAPLFHDQLLLPPHQKVRDLVEDSEIRKIPTPALLDKLYEQIDQIVRPGSVVLVAGGFVGKLLIARARARGGMVLDIGASADYWIGRATRGEFDFVDYGQGVESPRPWIARWLGL